MEHQFSEGQRVRVLENASLEDSVEQYISASHGGGDDLCSAHF